MAIKNQRQGGVSLQSDKGRTSGGCGLPDQAQSYSDSSLLGSSNGDHEHQQQVEELVSLARITVGLYKID